MDKQEKIVCAAVKFEQPVPGSSECIVVGIDYKDCESKDRFYELKANDDFLNLKWKKTSGYQKGFITNYNRFVDPVEAVNIANNSHQVFELRKLFGEYTTANMEGRESHSDLKARFKKYMDKVEEYKSIGLKPEDLY